MLGKRQRPTHEHVNERTTEHGWFRGTLWAIETTIWGRWGYWLNAINNGRAPSDAIPQIPFRQAGTPGAPDWPNRSEWRPGTAESLRVELLAFRAMGDLPAAGRLVPETPRRRTNRAAGTHGHRTNRARSAQGAVDAILTPQRNTEMKRNLSELEPHRLAGRRGDRSGAWSFWHEPTETILRVIASDGGGDQWEAAGLPGAPWEHVSVSTATRTPTWEEMEFVRKLFFRADETVMQLHVPEAEHINCHPHTLHLWRPTEAVIPRPPAEAVGPPNQEPKAAERAGEARRKAQARAAARRRKKTWREQARGAAERRADN